MMFHPLNALWSSVGNNCAATVANGLRQGGASVASSWQDWWNSWNVIWSPDDVNKYAKAIIQYQATVTIVLE